MRYLKDKIVILIFVVLFLSFFNIYLQNKSQSRLKYCVEPNLFDLKNVKDLETSKGAGKSSLNLNLKLLGTIVGNKSTAFIYDADAIRYGFYKLNGVVSGANIVSIALGRVILEKEGARQELVLADRRTDFTEGERRSFNEKPPFIFTVSPNEMIVRRSGVISQLIKANELLGKLKVLPVQDESSDKLKGFRVDNIPSGSIIEQAGLKSGDIICSAGGQRLERTQDILRAFDGLKNKTDIDVYLLRGGQPLTLKYKIRN